MKIGTVAILSLVVWASFVIGELSDHLNWFHHKYRGIESIISRLFIVGAPAVEGNEGGLRVHAFKVHV